MRETTKLIQLNVGGEMKQFRITKLDAFSGARLLKMLSSLPTDKKDQDKGGGNSTLWEMFFSLDEVNMDLIMKTCLSRAEISLPAGFIRVLENGCWCVPEFEYETMICITLSLEVMAFTLNGFFPESGQTSRPAADHISQ